MLVNNIKEYISEIYYNETLFNYFIEIFIMIILILYLLYNKY